MLGYTLFHLEAEKLREILKKYSCPSGIMDKKTCRFLLLWYSISFIDDYLNNRLQKTNVIDFFPVTTLSFYDEHSNYDHSDDHYDDSLLASHVVSSACETTEAEYFEYKTLNTLKWR